MPENQIEPEKKQMNRDQIIETGNKMLETLIQENVAEFSSFTNAEVLDLDVGNSVSRGGVLLEDKSQEVREKVICEAKIALHGMGLLLESTNTKPGTFEISIRNGGETEIV